MAKELTPQQLIMYLSVLGNKTATAWNTTLLKLMPRAELQAKKNIKRNFPGRRGYRLTGGLLNSVSHGFEKGDGKFLSTFLESSGIPYNVIHEFGGKITPKKAKNLWIKNNQVSSKRRNITPREFMKLMLSQGAGDSSRFAILRAKSSKKLTAFEFVNGRAQALFFLRKKVTIPERPYLRPAMKDMEKDFVPTFNKALDKEYEK